ncbi:MAG: hypothetical protein ABL893_08015, partial [Hyphomicrobium sp.]
MVGNAVPGEHPDYEIVGMFNGCQPPSEGRKEVHRSRDHHEEIDQMRHRVGATAPDQLRQQDPGLERLAEADRVRDQDPLAGALERAPRRVELELEHVHRRAVAD